MYRIELNWFDMTVMIGLPPKVARTVVCIVCVCVCVECIMLNSFMYTITGVASKYKQMSLQDPRGYNNMTETSLE